MGKTMKNTTVLKLIVMTLLIGMLANANKIEVNAAAPYEKIANKQEWKVLKIVNEKRIKKGQPPLSMFSKLQKASRLRSKEIAQSFSHTRPNGKSCFTALDKYNINYMAAGENIAAGQESAKAVMSSWMESSGHKANILNSNVTHIGVGYVEGGFYGKNWTQLFVGPCTTTQITMDTTKIKTYSKNTSIAKMNRYLVVTCSKHGTSYVPITQSMCSGYKKSQNGIQTIKVKYGNVKTKFKVKIK